MPLFRKAHAGNIYILDCVASEEVPKAARRQRTEEVSATVPGTVTARIRIRNLRSANRTWAGMQRRQPSPRGRRNFCGAARSVSQRGALMMLTSVFGWGLSDGASGPGFAITAPDGDPSRCRPSSLRHAFGSGGSSGGSSKRCFPS